MSAIRMILFLAVLLVPASASALTVRDIIELTKAGLSDDILVALIDADRTVFSLDKNEILALKKAGVSEAVLLKMIRSRRDFDPPAATPETEPVIPVPQPSVPELVVISAQPPPPPVTVVVPQYFYVPYSVWGVPRRHPIHAPQPVIAPEYRGFGRFINDGWVNRP